MELQGLFGEPSPKMAVPRFKQRFLILLLMLVYVCRRMAARGIVKKLKDYEQELVVFSDK